MDATEANVVSDTAHNRNVFRLAKGMRNCQFQGSMKSICHGETLRFNFA
jgi:hypothetical protein